MITVVQYSQLSLSRLIPFVLVRSIRKPEYTQTSAGSTKSDLLESQGVSICSTENERTYAAIQGTITYASLVRGIVVMNCPRFFHGRVGLSNRCLAQGL